MYFIKFISICRDVHFNILMTLNQAKVTFLAMVSSSSHTDLVLSCAVHWSQNRSILSPQDLLQRTHPFLMSAIEISIHKDNIEGMQCGLWIVSLRPCLDSWSSSHSLLCWPTNIILQRQVISYLLLLSVNSSAWIILCCTTLLKNDHLYNMQHIKVIVIETCNGLQSLWKLTNFLSGGILPIPGMNFTNRVWQLLYFHLL